MCPVCGSKKIGGLMSSFFVPLNSDGEPDGDWNDWSAESDLSAQRVCYGCEHEWETDR